MPHRATPAPLTSGVITTTRMDTPNPTHPSMNEIRVVPRRHPFLEAVHHPFIAGISHICSPLSAALLVFGIHKWWQRSAMQAWILAHKIQYNSTRTGKPTNTINRTYQTTATTNSKATNNPTASTSTVIRSYSTFTRVAMNKTFSSCRRACFSSLSSSAAASSFRFKQPFLASCSNPHYANSISHMLKQFSTPHIRSNSSGTALAAATTALTTSSSAQPTTVDQVISSTTLASSATNATASVHGASESIASSSPAASTPLDSSAFGPDSGPTLADIYGADDVALVLSHLSDVWSVVQMQEFIGWLHLSFDLPWWASISLATIALRLCAAPFEVLLLRNSLRMKTILPQIDQLQVKMKEAPTMEEKQVHAANLLQLFKTKGCSPMHGLYIPFIFPPVFLSLFGATHNLALAEPSMIAGGTLWFNDLVLPDPTWMLPVASSLTWIYLLESTAGYFYLSNPDFRHLCRTLALAFIPVVANMPAGVFCFWVTSNLFSIVRVKILNTDTVRRFLGIPLRREIAALSHLPRPITELLSTEQIYALARQANEIIDKQNQRQKQQETNQNERERELTHISLGNATETKSSS